MNIAILNQAFLTGVVRAFPEIATIGQEILPERSIDSWTSMWDVLQRDGKLAPFVSIDGESSIADETALSRVFHEVADIRQKSAISESDILNLRLAGEPDVVTSGMGRTRAQVAEENVRRQLQRLTARVRARVEWMRWKALATGTIAVTTGPVQFSVNFSIPGNNINTLTSTARWTDIANSDPIKNLEEMIEQVRKESGRRPKRAYVGSSVPGVLCQNAKVRDLFKATSQINQVLNPDSVLDFLGTILGLNITRYDAAYLDDSGTATFFLPEYSVVVLPEPNQPDGETLGDVATAPAAANSYQTGLYSWVTEERDPWRTFMGAGIHAFPRIYHPDWVGIIKTNG